MVVDELNWWCFFDIVMFVVVCVEDGVVFDVVYVLLLCLYVVGFVDGVCVDYVDGFVDLCVYCCRLYVWFVV